MEAEKQVQEAFLDEELIVHRSYSLFGVILLEFYCGLSKYKSFLLEMLLDK